MRENQSYSNPEKTPRLTTNKHAQPRNLERSINIEIQRQNAAMILDREPPEIKSTISEDARIELSILRRKQAMRLELQRDLQRPATIVPDPNLPLPPGSFPCPTSPEIEQPLTAQPTPMPKQSKTTCPSINPTQSNSDLLKSTQTADARGNLTATLTPTKSQGCHKSESQTELTRTEPQTANHPHCPTTTHPCEVLTATTNNTKSQISHSTGESRHTQRHNQIRRVEQRRQGSHRQAILHPDPVPNPTPPPPKPRIPKTHPQADESRGWPPSQLSYNPRAQSKPDRTGPPLALTHKTY